MKTKTPAESATQMTYLVLPNQTNTLNNLMGGELLNWMDITAAIAAGRHCNRVVVTASVDSVDFQSPIRLGEIVVVEAKVTRAFNTSVEVHLKVFAENQMTGLRRTCNEAFFTFVAIDQAGHPLPVNKLEPVTDEEKSLYESALARREARLASVKKKENQSS
jgi:acyl-CoA hydrolase